MKERLIVWGCVWFSCAVCMLLKVNGNCCVYMYQSVTALWPLEGDVSCENVRIWAGVISSDGVTTISQHFQHSRSCRMFWPCGGQQRSNLLNPRKSHGLKRLTDACLIQDDSHKLMPVRMEVCSITFRVWCRITANQSVYRPLTFALAPFKHWLFHRLAAVGGKLWHLSSVLLSPWPTRCCHGCKNLVLNGQQSTGEAGWWNPLPAQ